MLFQFGFKLCDKRYLKFEILKRNKGIFNEQLNVLDLFSVFFFKCIIKLKTHNFLYISDTLFFGTVIKDVKSLDRLSVWKRLIYYVIIILKYTAKF